MNIMEGIGNALGGVFGSGGFLDDLQTSEEERLQGQAALEQARANTAAAKAAEKSAAMQAETYQTLAFAGVAAVVIVAGVYLIK